MPTPSTSSPHLTTPVRPIDATSTRPTCPPDSDTTRNSWRGNPVECIENDADGGPTPTSASFPAYPLNRPLDDAAPQTNMSPSPQSDPEKSERAGDEDVAMGPMSPVGSVSTDGKYELPLSRQSTMSSVASSIPSSANSSSSMDYEYSNVRVSDSDNYMLNSMANDDHVKSCFQTIPPRTSVPAASLSEPSSQTGRSTTWMWKSSTLI